MQGLIKLTQFYVSFIALWPQTGSFQTSQSCLFSNLLFRPKSKYEYIVDRFSKLELLSAINDTKNTTPRPDNICYELFKHMSIKYLEVMLQLCKQNLVHRKNSSILATFHCCPYSKTKQTCALTVFLPPNIPDQQRL